MEWTDEGIVLGVRRHGESSAIVELLTREHGRHLGLVRGGAGSRMRPLLQPGNSVTAVWRARLDEHLGMYALEGTRLRAATLLASSHAVYGVTHLAALARLLPERDPHQDIYEMLQGTLDDFDDADVAAVHLIRFELAMLTELGFGLDLENCAATGETSDLIYVSPKSGGAVSRAAGEPWRDRLLPLPAFLREGETRRQQLVGAGPARRLPDHRSVPAPPRAGAARAGPFRRPRRLYQRRDQAAKPNGGSVRPIRALNSR
ncbi:DNA repair protein RecO (recombination protein O) [Bradyrhizobium sp. JR6.1]